MFDDEDDPMRAARGIVTGVVIGAAIWIIIGLLMF
jgi:hypothetical protein